MIVGIGFRPGTPEPALRAALAEALPGATAVATIAPRAAALRRLTDLPLHAIPADALRGVPTPTQSPRILALYGCGSLAEAAALVAAGPGARLAIPRRISHGVTWAAAEGAPS